MDRKHVFIFTTLIALAVGFKTPKGLKVKVTSPTTLHVTWKGNVDKSRDTSYIVRYRTTGEPYSFTETTGTELKSIRVRANVTYEISVRLVKGQRESSWSPAVYINTLQSVDLSTVYRTRSIRVKGLSSTSIKIKWRRPPKMKKSEISGYRLIWKRKKASKREIVTINKRSYIITGLKSNTAYTIRIQTIASDGRLSISMETTYRTPKRSAGSPPENIVVVALGSTKVKLKWEAPRHDTEKVTEYKIQYKRKGVKRGDMCTVTTNSWKREYTITDLSKGETYKVRMAAKTGQYTGPISDWKFVTLPGSKKNNSSSKEPMVSEPSLSHQEKMDKLFNLNVTSIKGGVNVTWEDVGMDVISYGLSVTKGVKILYINEVPFDYPLYVEILSLGEGETYNVTVKAIGPTGKLDGISSMSFKTPVSVSTAVSVTNLPFVGGNITLSCNVSGSPTPEIHWLTGNYNERIEDGGWFGRATLTQLEDPVARRLVSTLVIQNVSVADQNNYTCSAFNELEEATAQLMVEVKDPAPSPIKSVSTVPLSPYQVKVTWEPPEEETFSTIYYRIILAKGGSQVSNEFVTDTPEYTLNGLSPDTLYYLKVVAFNEYGDNDKASTTVFVFRTKKVLPKPLLNVMTLNENTFLVRWTSVSDLYPNLYKITYGVLGDTETLARKILPPNNEILLYDIKENSDYRVKVDAVFDDEVSSSDWVTASSRRTSFQSEARRPTPPADVFLTVKNSTLVISWLPPHIEYGTLVRWYQLDMFKRRDLLYRKRISADMTNYSVDPFDETKQHTVYISAVNLKGASDAVLRMYQPISVMNLKGRPISSTSVVVEWLPPQSRLLTRYLVRYRTMQYNDSDIVDKWLDPSENIYVINGLEEFQEYVISVIPYLNETNGNDASVTVKTYPDVPSAPPVDVNVLFVNATVASIRWAAPMEADRNGEIIRYSIAYRVKGEKYDQYQYREGNVTDANITDLQPDSEYYIRVAAITINGTGPYSTDAVVKTTPLIVARELPGLPHKFTTTPVPYGIHLKWLPPENPDIPVGGYIVGYGRFIPEVYREVLGPDTFEFTISKLRQNNDYIVTLRAFNDFGESAAAFKVATAGDGKMSFDDDGDNEEDNFNNGGNGTNNGIDDAPADVRVEINHDDVPAAIVRWQSPLSQKGKIKDYIVYYKTREEERWHAVIERLLSSTIKNLAFSTTYVFRVQVQYQDGSQGKLSKTVKAKTKSLDDMVTVLPKPTITSVFSGTDYLQVNWKPPLSDYLHVIVGFTLGYGVLEANENQEFIPVSQRSFKIENLKADREYIISLRMFNEHGESEKAIVQARTLAAPAGNNGAG